MTNFLVDRDIVCVFFLFVIVAGCWLLGFLDGAFLGMGIKTYFKTY